MKKLSFLFCAVFFTVMTMPVFSIGENVELSLMADEKKTKKTKKTKKSDGKSWIHNGKFSIGAGYISIQTQGHTTTKYTNEQMEYTSLLAGIAPQSYYEETAQYTDNTLGGYLFFDATYGEFDLSFCGTKGLGENWQTFDIGIGLFVKYPFKLGKTGLTLSPILGAQFNIVALAWDDYGMAISGGEKKTSEYGTPVYTGIIYRDAANNAYAGSVVDLSNISLKIGLDLRVPLSTKSPKFYFDAQYMWGYRFESKYEGKQNEFKLGDSQGGTDEISEIVPFKSNLTLKLAFGFML
ncbi:hypothetical protein FACS1894102_3710 [Spirochaetia bacterium]|nr:hypothetical protein FACS1894102_3710 [Spirochaetia bacterium]